jgi:hypothetical protein
VLVGGGLLGSSIPGLGSRWILRGKADNRPTSLRSGRRLRLVSIEGGVSAGSLPKR